MILNMRMQKKHTVPKDKSSRCAMSEHLRWSKGDFSHLHLLTVSLWETNYGRMKQQEINLILRTEGILHSLVCYLLCVCAPRCHFYQHQKWCCCCCECEDSVEGQETQAESLETEKWRNTVWMCLFFCTEFNQGMNNIFKMSRLCFNTSLCILIILHFSSAMKRKILNLWTGPQCYKINGNTAKQRTCGVSYSPLERFVSVERAVSEEAEVTVCMFVCMRWRRDSNASSSCLWALSWWAARWRNTHRYRSH